MTDPSLSGPSVTGFPPAASALISPLERMHRFIDELRTRGMPITVAERVDAMRAAEIAEYGQSDGLRTALGCTLVKTADHLAVFDEVFDLYFLPPVAGRAASEEEGDGRVADATSKEVPDLAPGGRHP